MEDGVHGLADIVSIHPLWFVVILGILLIVFGPGRLPEIGGAIGKALREFRRSKTEDKDGSSPSNPPG